LEQLAKMRSTTPIAVSRNTRLQAVCIALPHSKPTRAESVKDHNERRVQYQLAGVYSNVDRFYINSRNSFLTRTEHNGLSRSPVMSHNPLAKPHQIPFTYALTSPVSPTSPTRPPRPRDRE
jgi:hypothetical protein